MAFDDIEQLPANFSGTVRLFPLPNLVLFPRIMQPLHIFEPRYRAMLEAALADDQLITTALLSPGWEADYEGRPPVYPVGCLGRVLTHHQRDDGTYNLLLLGLHRVRVVEELPPAESYRQARVTLCDDDTAVHAAEQRADLQRQLRQAFLRVVPNLPEAREHIDQILGGDLGLGTLTDLIAYMVDLRVADKYELLAELNVVRRAEALLQHLAAAECQEAASHFPPPFSAN